eukprot:Colp12_sorted_trinity150504_noHs@15867
MAAPARMDPPIVGKVSHNSIELYWNPVEQEGATKIRYTIQEYDAPTRSYGNIYNGFLTRCVANDLEPRSEYQYRLRASNEFGHGEWSPLVHVKTTKRPLGGPDLHRAASNNDLATIREAIDKSVDVDVPDNMGVSPLMTSAQSGAFPAAETLILKGADVNFANGSGKTPLMLACFNGHIDIIKLLLRHGADTSAVDKGGSNCLMWAVDGAQPEVVSLLISKGMDVNASDTRHGWTPLIRTASLTGSKEIAEILINAGALVNVTDADGKTPLMIAALNGHTDLVKLLVERYADIYATTQHGKTALELARGFKRTEVVQLLEEAQANAAL